MIPLVLQSGQRRRTKGGVYLTLLKTKADVPQQQLDEIFEEEQQWYQEKLKRRKQAKYEGHSFYFFSFSFMWFYLLSILLLINLQSSNEASLFL
jgi:hypothetical protein